MATRKAAQATQAAQAYDQESDELLGSKKKPIPPKFEDVITDRKDRKKFEQIVTDLANMRDARKELEENEKEAKDQVAEFREKYGFQDLHVGSLKLSISDQTRESLNRDALIEYARTELGMTVPAIKAMLEASTKVSSFSVIRVGEIPKGELKSEFD